MKSLIRFEDTYGMTDIFCARNNIPYLDIQRIQERMIEINSETFIDFGLASAWGNISNDEAYSIMERGIERILFVYDMDDLKGDKEVILQYKDLEGKIRNIEAIFRRIGYNVEVYFIPVVYAAETLMLYQYLGENDDMQIQDFVSSVNTWELHLCLLAYFIGEENTKKAKRFRNFLQINELVNIYKNALPNDMNCMLKQWIVEGCILNKDYLFDKYEALEHLKDIECRFNIWKSKSDRIIWIEGKEIKLNGTVKPLL